eukprot:TRINITY_DN954_c0_g2_i1.p1 TRINITY_DN954_c0_g2~~TRINITY_DN954_c0_g2_i1.p1  ORF type:complete len:240 (+),score=96.19 TRINITY_DN954_c0_g2_i1:92-811(+)
MPKKVGVNSKAEEAKARKESAAAEKKEKEKKEKEDAQWRDEGATSKAAKKREEDERKKAEAAAKRAEAKKLAEQEEREMEKVAKKGVVKGDKLSATSSSSKITAAKLQEIREKEQKALQERMAMEQKKKERVVGADEYGRSLEVANENRMESLVDAHSLDEAISQLHLSSGTGETSSKQPVDMHPEKRLKAAYKAFEEAQLTELRSERPGLTLTQYKELIWKAWKKSPQNPLNQAPPPP